MATPGSSDGLLNGTTEVEVVAAPGVGLARVVRTVTVFNQDTVNHTVTIGYKHGADLRKVWLGVLAVDQVLVWNDPLVLDDVDKSLVAHSDAPATTTEPVFTAHWMEE